MKADRLRNLTACLLLLALAGCVRDPTAPLGFAGRNSVDPGYNRGWKADPAMEAEIRRRDAAMATTTHTAQPAVVAVTAPRLTEEDVLYCQMQGQQTAAAADTGIGGMIYSAIGAAAAGANVRDTCLRMRVAARLQR